MANKLTQCEQGKWGESHDPSTSTSSKCLHQHCYNSLEGNNHSALLRLAITTTAAAHFILSN